MDDHATKVSSMHIGTEPKHRFPVSASHKRNKLYDIRDPYNAIVLYYCYQAKGQWNPSIDDREA